MRSRSVEAVSGAGAEFGLDARLVGIGEPLALVPGELAEAVDTTAAEHGAKAARLLDAFAAAEPGSFVWTRDEGGRFHLGRIMGGWRYERSAAAERVGIHHVRAARWRLALAPDGVPPRVIYAFDRGGRNFQRIRDREAEEATAHLWRLAED